MRKLCAAKRLASAAVLAAMVAGCAKPDERLKNLSAGITADSLFKVMGVTAAHRRDPYLYAGQYIEAYYFPRLGKADSASVQDRNMSPVITVNGKVAVWGWSQWDSLAVANKIVVAPKN